MNTQFQPNFLLNNLNIFLTSGVQTSAVLPNSETFLITVYGDGNIRFITNNITSATFDNSIIWPNGCRDIIKTSDKNIHFLSDDSCYVNIVGGTI